MKLVDVREAIGAKIPINRTRFEMVYVRKADGTELFFPRGTNWEEHNGCIKMKNAARIVIVRFMPGTLLEIWVSYRAKLEAELAAAL